MLFTPQKIPDVLLITPKIHNDDRGYFFESFRQDKLEERLSCKINFCQDNESKSTKGVLRGLHFQLPPFAQSKLVRVVKGEVLDVAVDIRKNSPTFGSHVSVILNSKRKQQLYIPKGFAHGFIVLSKNAVLAYKVDNYYAPKHDRGLAYDDPEIGIDWILPSKDLITSAKDNSHPTLKELYD